MFNEYGGRAYGDLTLIGDNGDDFFKSSVKKQALALGFSEACPIAPDLV